MRGPRQQQDESNGSTRHNDDSTKVTGNSNDEQQDQAFNGDDDDVTIDDCDIPKNQSKKVDVESTLDDPCLLYGSSVFLIRLPHELIETSSTDAAKAERKFNLLERNIFKDLKLKRAKPSGTVKEPRITRSKRAKPNQTKKPEEKPTVTAKHKPYSSPKQSRTRGPKPGVKQEPNLTSNLFSCKRNYSRTTRAKDREGRQSQPSSQPESKPNASSSYKAQSSHQTPSNGHHQAPPNNQQQSTFNHNSTFNQYQSNAQPTFQASWNHSTSKILPPYDLLTVEDCVNYIGKPSSVKTGLVQLRNIIKYGVSIVSQGCKRYFELRKKRPLTLSEAQQEAKHQRELTNLYLQMIRARDLLAVIMEKFADDGPMKESSFDRPIAEIIEEPD